MKEMILKTGKFQFLIGTVLPVEQTKGGKNNEAVCFNSL